MPDTNDIKDINDLSRESVPRTEGSDSPSPYDCIISVVHAQLSGYCRDKDFKRSFTVINDEMDSLGIPNAVRNKIFKQALDIDLQTNPQDPRIGHGEGRVILSCLQELIDFMPLHEVPLTQVDLTQKYNEFRDEYLRTHPDEPELPFQHLAGYQETEQEREQRQESAKHKLLNLFRRSNPQDCPTEIKPDEVDKLNKQEIAPKPKK